MMTGGHPQLLSGVRVIDLSQNLSGPYGSMLLADMGADVIKVEPLTGDPQRTLIPFVDGVSLLFTAVNRNKRGVAINLKDPEGRQLLLRLISQSNVVYNNYRPGVMNRLGLSFAELKQANPRIVASSLSGYGRTGPKALWPAYDVAIQALSGGMSLTGYAGSAPARAGIPIADLAGGIFNAIGVLAGLVSRSLRAEAVEVDIGMLDTQISLLMYWAAIGLNSDLPLVPQGSGNTNTYPYGAYRCDDGYVVIAIWGESFWPKLCQALGHPEWLEDERFSNNTLRSANRAELHLMIETALGGKGRDQWLEILRAADVPCAPINSVREAMADEQVLMREMNIPVISQSGRELRFAGNPVKSVPSTEVPARMAPVLGEHTREVLAEFGFGNDEIKDLSMRGITLQAEAMTT